MSFESNQTPPNAGESEEPPEVTPLVQKAVAALHDLNNPLSFLMANQMVEQEHAQALSDLMATLTKLNDPRVDDAISRFDANGRVQELGEILTDNGDGLKRIHLISRSLRDTLLGPPKVPTRRQGRSLT